MIKVRYFGLLRLDIKKSSDDIEARNIEELIEKISEKYNININEIKNSIIFVNGQSINQVNILKTRLEDGDEVQFFSPAAGG